MNEAILNMLKKYSCVSQQDYKNALKEIIQEVALLGLWRAKFFEKAAFYGGTSLRILHGLNRFSEDLDFSLLHPEPSFSLIPYERAIKTELESFGFDVTIQTVEKTQQSAIESAFLKANTLENFLRIGVPPKERKKCHFDESIKIKLECDRDPPVNFSTEARFLLQPIPFSVVTYTPSDLFAGKLHALLFRSWKNRVKGRDWYDFIWFVSQGIPVHLKHLEERMKQTGHLENDSKLTFNGFQKFLLDKIDQLDVEQAKKDILPFIRDPNQLSVWSRDFFRAVANQVKAI